MVDWVGDGGYVALCRYEGDVVAVRPYLMDAKPGTFEIHHLSHNIST